jgi:hypothetical protein
MTRRFLPLAVLTLAGLLSACGGGGGGGGTTPPPSGCSAASFQVSADDIVVVGKAAGATVASSCGSITEVLWRQTAGPTVELLSARTQAISFEPAMAGIYAFSVDFRDATGVARSLPATVTATTPTAAVNVLVRADQAVREGGKASVRAWPAAGSGETITWTQVAGPAVTLDTSDQNRVLFTAPAVSQDTLIVLRATKQVAGGGTDSDDVRVLVENHEQAPADPSNNGPYVFSDSHVSRVYAYRANGPFAGALVRCTYDVALQHSGSGANLCPLAMLPLLDQTTGGAVPTVDQIMDRVVVSHDWMGQVFEEFLATQANDDIKRLFNGVTAIVIGAHVRPSFYYAVTGAIYLDADNFWLTAPQRDVIDETPDFRSDFDRLLNYSTAWRYTEGNQSIFVNTPPSSRIARTQSYLLAEAGWLLFHELAHASDFMPPSARSALDSSQSVWGNIVSRLGSGSCAGSIASDELCREFPLTSQEMFGLAQVKFAGATPTAAQQAYTPQQVAGFFAADRATDDYNYSTTREDLAMLFEEFMMYRMTQGAWRRDMAITDKITDDTTGANLVVRWGQRGRVGDPRVKERAVLAVSRLAPWVPSAEVQALPAPLDMRAGESWTGNLTLPAPLGGLARVQALRPMPDFDAERALLLRDVTGGRRASPNDRFIQRLGR